MPEPDSGPGSLPSPRRQTLRLCVRSLYVKFKSRGRLLPRQILGAEGGNGNPQVLGPWPP